MVTTPTGNLISHTDRDGNVISYSYDAIDRKRITIDGKMFDSQPLAVDPAWTIPHVDHVRSAESARSQEGCYISSLADHPRVGGYRPWHLNLNGSGG